MSWSARILAKMGASELDVELSGQAGVLAIVGPNGAGKSSLLRAMMGAGRAIQHARVSVGDVIWHDTEQAIDVPIEQRRIGYLPQHGGLFRHLSVLDNVAFGLAVSQRSLPRAERRARALQALEELGCAHLEGRRPRRLSGGETQRVALARALVVDPVMLMLDEPLAALDAITRRRVRELLADKIAALGRPCLWVTHDVRDVEALGARVCVLRGGRVTQVGALSELRASPSCEFVAEFVGA